MSESTPRSSKRLRKPSAKARSPVKKASAKTTSKHSPALFNPGTPGIPAVGSVADSNQVGPGLLADIHNELISLRAQVSNFKASESAAPSTLTPTYPPPSIASPNPLSGPATTVAPRLKHSSSIPISPPTPARSPPPIGSSFKEPSSDRPISPMSAPTRSAETEHGNSATLLLPPEELLAARDYETDSDGGEPSSVRASRKLRKKTMSVSGSLGASLFPGLGQGSLSSFSPSANSNVDRI